MSSVEDQAQQMGISVGQMMGPGVAALAKVVETSGLQAQVQKVVRPIARDAGKEAGKGATKEVQAAVDASLHKALVVGLGGVAFMGLLFWGLTRE